MSLTCWNRLSELKRIFKTLILNLNLLKNQTILKILLNECLEVTRGLIFSVLKYFLISSHIENISYLSLRCIDANVFGLFHFRRKYFRAAS